MLNSYKRSHDFICTLSDIFNMKKNENKSKDEDEESISEELDKF
jgi:hypothetical protein